MTGWIANRMGALEARVEYLMRLIADLTQQLRGAQQSSKGVGASFQNLPSGGGGGAFFATPAGAVTGNSSFTANVSQFVAGSSTVVATAATIYNNFAASLVAGLQCFVVPDGAGNYVVVTQSCT
jgi:hypothetical protein